MGTAKLYIQAKALTRKQWPSCAEAEEMVDSAWEKAVKYHDRQVNMVMLPSAMGDLVHRGAREIASSQFNSNFCHMY